VLFLYVPLLPKIINSNPLTENFCIIKNNIVMRDKIQLYEAKWYYPDGVARKKILRYLCAKI